MYVPPLPAMIEATWVPWPCPSWAPASALKFAVAAIRPARSGWAVSTPVSSTATLTPWPLSPAAHACVAPIWATLRSRVTRTLRSSQIFCGPDLARSNVCQNRPVSFLSIFTALPSMLGRARALASVAGACCMITGVVALSASV